MGFQPLPRGRHSWLHTARRTLALTLAGTLAVLVWPHLVLWPTERTLPGSPEPVTFTGSVPDAGYDARRWRILEVVRTRSRLYGIFQTGRVLETRAGSRDSWRTSVVAYDVARQALGHSPSRVGVGVWRDGPGRVADAAGLRDGDVIVRFAGHRVRTMTDLFDALRPTVDEPTTVTYLRAGTRTTVPLTVRSGDVSVPLLGFAGADGTPTVTPPFTPTTPAAEGDSDGLLTALAYLDALTPGSLAGPYTVAGTGALGVDGTVSPVGSVAAKVRGAGAVDVVLTPAGANTTQARSVGADAPVVPVATFTDAVSWLCSQQPTVECPALGRAAR